ncbi:MORC family CW-type zinc finger protein 4-like [Dorcoceras hygrometricum]|uniref:MORC family CW-type zinc finger protein 4-like n=1 Tax=Dorcoceras hygrometricum TaxID=472368 RepID=A0A2Z7BPT3_9LAMI|nr:MORC family CW-type zinc finger protein 4-like [Dorcoceras hygrometricum]
MKRRRVEESADGLREQSQESAGSLYIQTQERSDVVEEQSSRKLLFTSRCYLEIAIAKRCRLHKLIRQRFALALKIQQEDFALLTSRKIQSQATVDPDASNSSIQSRKLYAFSRKLKHPVATYPVAVFEASEVAQSIQSTKISAEDEFSRSDKPVAKQLTIYESWMSTAELNSNGESDKTQLTLKMERING